MPATGGGRREQLDRIARRLRLLVGAAARVVAVAALVAFPWSPSLIGRAALAAVFVLIAMAYLCTETAADALRAAGTSLGRRDASSRNQAAPRADQ
jgi:hypothetical protein